LAGLLVAAPHLPGAAGPAGRPEAGRPKAEACAGCHGPGGRSTRPDVPSLAGQPALYTYLQLVQFRERRRDDPGMAAVAAVLSDDDMRDLAAYFAAEAPPAGAEPADPRRAAAGRRVAEAHHCVSCHAPGLTGQDHIPRLVGLSRAYLLRQLRGFKAQTRADIDGSMTTAARPLSEEDIEDVVHFIVSLSPVRRELSPARQDRR